MMVPSTFEDRTMPNFAQFSALAVLSAACATSAAADDVAKWAREANDRAEIQALIWRYERALDSLDVDAYVAVFTEDAVFGDAKGREGIRALISGVKASREKSAGPGKAPVQTYQSIQNMTITFTSETTAKIEGYYMALIGAQNGNPARVATTGREVDEAVKQNGQWLISRRTVSP
jgi:uncharacterized protein (TIGR02246 family)